jgi:hypothetical protein
MWKHRRQQYLLAVPLVLATVQAASADVAPGNLSYIPSALFTPVNGASSFYFNIGNGNRDVAFPDVGGDPGDLLYGNSDTTASGVVGEAQRDDAYSEVFNSLGQVAATTYQSGPLLLRAYLTNGTALGPTGADYTFNGATYGQPVAEAVNANYVIGIAGRSAQVANPSVFGFDAWAYLPTTATSFVIGPTGVGPTGKDYDDIYTTSYNASTGAGIYRFSQAVDVNDNGIATGYTDFNYKSSGATNGSNGNAYGRDAWIEDITSPTPTPVIVGLLGAGYTYNSTFTPSGGSTLNYVNNSSTIYGINDAGTAIGSSLRYSPGYSGSSFSPATTSDSGQDAWIYDSTLGTVQIGLIGNIYSYDQGKGPQGYLQTSLAYQINSQNQVAGYSYTYGPSTRASNSSAPAGDFNSPYGQDAWIYTPVTSGNVVTAAGTANSYGTTAIGTYTQVGLIDSLATSPGSSPGSLSPTSIAGHVASDGSRGSFISGFNNLGQAAGISTRYFNSGPDSTFSWGQDAWFFDGTKTTIINPVSPTPGVSYYSTYLPDGLPYADSGVTALTDSGLVAGWTYRFPTGDTGGVPSDNIGQDAWVYDSTHNNGDGTFGKIFAITAPTASTAYEALTINYLSNKGIAIGTFSDGSTSSPFVWTETGGYQSLTAILANSLSAAGLQSLTASIGSGNVSSALYIDGKGDIFGIGTNTSGTPAIYQLTPSIPGDANNDGIVSLSDLAIVLNNFGQNTPLWSNGNFDAAPTIDLTDLADVLNNFGAGGGSPTIVVPEPASLGLLAFGTLALAARRRRRA